MIMVFPMNELQLSFDELFEQYQHQFPLMTFTASSRAEFMQIVPTQLRGVYSYWKKDATRPFYIGCAGKVGKDGRLSGNTIKARMFQANTPYHFKKEANTLCFGPTTAGVPPAGYVHSIDMSDIVIRALIIEDNTAPAALEHILIQGYVNQYHSLPQANQKL